MTRKYVSIVLASTLTAIAAPDSGSQTKQIEQDIAKKEKELSQKHLVAPKKKASPDTNSVGFKTRVTAFDVSGMASFDSKTVIPSLLKEFLNKELTLSDIRKAADAIQGYYADRGLIARVTVPAQSVENGVVKLLVTEGKAGEVILEDANATKMKGDKLREYLYRSQPKGSVLSMDGLQKGLYILNELPGLSVGSSLLPGAADGFTDILISAKDTVRADGMTFLDNYGSRFTGAVQATAIGSVNDLAGKGLYDQLSARVLKTQGSNYGRLAYSLPVGTSGLKLGINGSKMDYKINTLSSASGYSGESDSAGVSADYPLIRTKDKNLSLNFTLDRKHYQDKDNSDTVISSRRVNAINSTILGDSSDEYMGGGQSNFSATFTKGDVYSGNNPGNYYKTSATASRLQRVDDNWQLFAQATGQKADKNLDSSEKMTIGGSSGVRAYPTGEASADEGMVATAELRRSLGNGLQAVVFYDYGFAHINHDKTDTNAYSLSGVGAGITYTKNSLISKFQLAKPVGPNKGEQSNGNDSDGLKPSARIWASVQYKF